jgi:type I restriction enzyme, S subunit
MDALLTQTQKCLEKKKAIKQGLMQHLLVPKTEWKIKSLVEVCSMKSGNSITSKEIQDLGSYPCYGGNGIRGYTSRYTHDGAFSIIGRQGALCGNVQFVFGKFFASEHAVVVSPKHAMDMNWLSYVLLKMNLNQYSESSAQPGLSVAKLLMLPIFLPPTMEEQTRIAEILTDADQEIQALEHKIEKWKQQKQGMMQALLTGV